MKLEKYPSTGFPNQQSWLDWLHKNHSTNDGIWMRIGKKGAPYPSITYMEALDVALCYGWIDGQKRSYDEHFFLQRFTPRRKRSIWSKVNTLKIEALTKEGKMHPAGLAQVGAAKEDGRWAAAYDSQKTMEVPADLLDALAKNKKAQEAFNALTASGRYSHLFRIQTAKDAETRATRIAQIIDVLTGEK